jgi:hypothetical protein
MRVLTGIMAAGVLAALAGCGEKPAAKTEAASATSAAPAAAPTPTAAAWPKRKPGLWSQTMKLEAPGGFSRSFRSCIDEATDQKLGLYSDAAGAQCAKGQISRTADGGWTVTSTCDTGTAGQTQSTVHVTGDFNQRYVMIVDSTTTGAAQPAMNGQHKMTMTAEWSGACPEGWAGGDVEMPGGGRMNLLTKAVAGAG